jgi:hypothetical protein
VYDELTNQGGSLCTLNGGHYVCIHDGVRCQSGLSIGALGAWLVGVPSEVVIGGLAGAVIFVTFAAEYPIKRRLLLSVISFFCGLLFYKPTATILIGLASNASRRDS